SETTSETEHAPPSGLVAIVTAGLAIGIILVGIQLWLLTIALDLYLSGQTDGSWGLLLVSGCVFLGGLLLLGLLARQTRARSG
ncbi:MAG TPA: DUF6755 family protein, partial [Ktedonobacteraceae bacterium]|nr:DUF6755 family protein [Ktedonobacteraceae bacterium]